SVVSERHPLFIGLYEGAIGDVAVTRFVEESDCVLMLGTFITDINLGIFTAKLDPSRCILATSETLRISHHHFHNVDLKAYLGGLIAAAPATTTRDTTNLVVRTNTETAEEAASELLQTSWMVRQLN